MNIDKTYVQLCLDGKCGIEDIDEFVETWHKHETGTPLWEFLGMSREEYGSWVEDYDALPKIIDSHREKVHAG